MRIFAVLFVSLTVLASPVTAGHHKSGEGSGDGKQGRFAKYDANGDGKITREEFMSMAGKRFDKMDANGDGSLSKGEMKRPHKKRRDD